MTGHYLYLGSLVVGGALVIAGWARIYRDAWSIREDQQRLVREGIYRYLRHPQYAGLMLLATGALCEWATIPLLILWPVVVYQYVALARREERDLAARFPDAWPEYQLKTGMFTPRMPRCRHRRI
jgi:protein-S-isoprenylcysteine O-methyltransferase Ste14